VCNDVRDYNGFKCNLGGICVNRQCKIEHKPFQAYNVEPKWQCCPGLACVGLIGGNGGVRSNAECEFDFSCPSDRPYCEQSKISSEECYSDNHCSNGCDMSTYTCNPGECSSLKLEYFYDISL
jgi:hypothetical protein